MRKLTDDECSEISNALRVAAESFEESAAACMEAPAAVEQIAQLAEQLKRQAKSVRQWSEYFGNSPVVAVSECSYCANEEEHPPGSICADRPLLRLFDLFNPPRR
jgi:hypothetical protein